MKFFQKELSYGELIRQQVENILLYDFDSLSKNKEFISFQSNIKITKNEFRHMWE